MLNFVEQNQKQYLEEISKKNTIFLATKILFQKEVALLVYLVYKSSVFLLLKLKLFVTERTTSMITWWCLPLPWTIIFNCKEK